MIVSTTTANTYRASATARLRFCFYFFIVVQLQLSAFSPHPSTPPLISFIIPIFEMRKLRHRVAKQLAQGYTARRGRSQVCIQCFGLSKAILFTSLLWFLRIVSLSYARGSVWEMFFCPLICRLLHWKVAFNYWKFILFNVEKLCPHIPFQYVLN